MLFAYVFNQRFSAIGAQSPKAGVSDAAKVPFETCRCSAPALLTATVLPEAICFNGVPRGHVHAICNVRHRDFDLRPSRKQHLKKSATDLPMEPAYTVDGTAAADG